MMTNGISAQKIMLLKESIHTTNKENDMVSLKDLS